jgi:hypothetical protein
MNYLDDNNILNPELVKNLSQLSEDDLEKIIKQMYEIMNFLQKLRKGQ